MDAARQAGIRRGSLSYLLGELVGSGTLERTPDGYAFTDPFLDRLTRSPDGDEPPI